GLIAGVYRAIGRLPRSALLAAVQQIALLFVTVLLIAVQVDLIVLASARVFVGVALVAWLIWDLRRWLPWLGPWPVGGSWRAGVGMLGPSLFFLLIPLSDLLSTQMGLAVVQRNLDGAEVTRLATHRTTVNMAVLASGIFMQACWPELTALRAKE